LLYFSKRPIVRRHLLLLADIKDKDSSFFLRKSSRSERADRPQRLA